MARKRKYINRQTLKALAQAQLSNDEISTALRVSWDTIARRYAEAINAWRREGVASIRRELYITALGDSKGKVSAMIFFLKNFGGMSDFHRHEHEQLEMTGVPIPREFRDSRADRPN